MATSRPKKANGKTIKRTRVEKRNISEALDAMREEGITALPPKTDQRRQARRKAERASKPKRKCPGTNGVGEPCKAPPLRKGTVVEDVEVSGEFCLFHDPDIPPEAWKKNKQIDGTKKIVARNHTQRRPMDLLADAVSRVPHLLFEPHLRGLGLEWDPDSEQIVPKLDKSGRRSVGATHVGFSREGIAKKSRHADFALQAKLADSVSDRLYGKARMAVDIAGEATIKMPEIPQTAERAVEVAKILAECSATVDPGTGDGEDLPEDNE